MIAHIIGLQQLNTLNINGFYGMCTVAIVEKVFLKVIEHIRIKNRRKVKISLTSPMVTTKAGIATDKAQAAVFSWNNQHSWKLTITQS